MVGNDIIDLFYAEKESNWQRPRYLDKVFSKDEQKLIYKSENPFLKVWQLWGAKESAYKLYTQLHPSRFYNPKEFQCSFYTKGIKVCYRDFSCWVSSRAYSDYIISEARLKQSKIKSSILRLAKSNQKTNSGKVREAIFNHISKEFKVSTSELRLKKSEFGIPYIFFKSKKINLSISHHGAYGAYVIDC